LTSTTRVAGGGPVEQLLDALGRLLADPGIDGALGGAVLKVDHLDAGPVPPVSPMGR